MSKKEDHYKSETEYRPFLQGLVFERDGDMNLTWLFVLIMGVVGAAGFWYTITHDTTVFERIAAWTFLGSAFASVLIASLPIAKAKILANAKLPGDIANSISSVAPKNVEVSTDVQELVGKRKHIEESG